MLLCIWFLKATGNKQLPHYVLVRLLLCIGWFKTVECNHDIKQLVLKSFSMLAFLWNVSHAPSVSEGLIITIRINSDLLISSVSSNNVVLDALYTYSCGHKCI